MIVIKRMNLKFAAVYTQKLTNEEHLRVSRAKNIRMDVNKFNDLYLVTAF